LTSDLQDWRPAQPAAALAAAVFAPARAQHAFDVLYALLETYAPVTPDEAALFVEPLVADRVWTRAWGTGIPNHRQNIIEYLDAMANKSEVCAREIAYHSSFLDHVLDYNHPDIDLLNTLQMGDTPWLKLLVRLKKMSACKWVQAIVPTEEALLEAIRANGSLYSAIERYDRFTNVHKDEYGTCLLCSIFNIKRDEMHEAAANAERNPDPRSVHFVLNKYMEDLRLTNVPTMEDVKLRQEKELDQEETPVETLLTPDQRKKLKRYGDYMAFVETIVDHQDFSSICDFVTKRGGDNETDQTLGDDLDALLKELERPVHTDKEETWALRHIVDVYSAGDDMQRVIEELVTRRRDDEARRVSFSGAPKRARTSAAALRAVLAAHVGVTTRV